MKNNYVNCYDDELGEVYIGQLVTDTDKSRLNRFVRIVQVKRYPAQHAIVWKDVASEIPPFRYGDVTILTVGEPVTIGKYQDNEEAYQRSFESALANRIAETESEDELAILRRHQRGQVTKIRRTIKFTGG